MNEAVAVAETEAEARNISRLFSLRRNIFAWYFIWYYLTVFLTIAADCR